MLTVNRMSKADSEFKDISERKLALVLVDIQRKFIAQTEGLKRSVEARLDNINAALDLFRSTGNPVIFVFYEGEMHGPPVDIDDPDGLVDGLTMVSTDHVVRKTGMNSFKDSKLEELIKGLGCDGAIIAGLVAQYCVIATYYGAFDRDICPYMLMGGIAATDEVNVEHVEAICKTVTLDDIRRNPLFN